jgi:hypothetical protein
LFKKGLRKFAEKYKEFEEKYPRVKKVMDVALSRTTGRVLMIAGAGITLALAAAGTGGLIFPAIALGGTIAAVATGIGFQVHTLRNLRRLKETEKLLQDQVENIKNNKSYINNINLDIKQLIDTARTTDIERIIKNSVGHIDDPMKDQNKASRKEVPEPNMLRSGAKTVRANAAENILAIGLNIVAFNPLGLGVAITGTLLGNATGAVVKRAQDEEKYATKKSVKELSDKVPGYDTEKELEQRKRDNEIFNKATKALEKQLNDFNLSPEQKCDILAKKIDEIVKNKEVPPISKPNPVVQLFKDVLTVLNPLAKKEETPKIDKGQEGDANKNKQEPTKSKNSVEQVQQKQNPVKEQGQNKQDVAPVDLHPDSTPNIVHNVKKKKSK